MAGVFQRLRYWGPLVLWMAVIFWASSDAESGRRGSRLLGPLLRWLLPESSADTIDGLLFLLRKVAHVSEYAVLAVLAGRPFEVWPGPSGSGTRSRPALLAWGFCVLYAVSDEWHQSFVPTRVGTAWDVLIDGVGAALGLAAAMLWRRRGHRSGRRPE
ncbi:MAG: VanZ family protein [Verrucomicrobiota bacterium]